MRAWPVVPALAVNPPGAREGGGERRRCLRPGSCQGQGRQHFHPPGTKAGDVIHIFQSGSIQMVTDVSIDPAGNFWVANNWNKLKAAAPDPSRPTSTWGGGSGFTVIME
jgi:hypothetical protein